MEICVDISEEELDSVVSTRLWSDFNRHTEYFYQYLDKISENVIAAAAIQDVALEEREQWLKEVAEEIESEILFLESFRILYDYYNDHLLVPLDDDSDLLTTARNIYILIQEILT